VRDLLPVHLESGTMPAYDGLGLDNEERLIPSRPTARSGRRTGKTGAMPTSQ
jgi:hypothetical protein